MKQALLFIKKYMPNLLMHKIGKVSFLLAFVLMMMGGESVMGQIYQEDFGNNQTVVLPYSSGTNATGSVIKNINITTPSWNQNLTSANLAGNTLGAMSATTGTSSYTITCTFSVNSGFQLIPTSIGFDNRGSSTGPSALTVTITGTGGSTTVSLSPSKTGAFTTTTATNFLNTNLNLTGNITLTFAFSGGSSGSTERFDNMILNGTVSAISSGALTSPTLSAASTPSVDAPFNVSFTDDASWRAAITSITVGGTTLSASAYTISAGQITFTPSASSLLQTPGTKSIVVISTGYNNATVSQVIVAGVPANLTMSTQPSAPATSGAVLATMPAVLVKDQYSNLLSGIVVSSAITSGQTTSWSLGGATQTATTNASGIATFSTLTATNITSPSAPYAATLSFAPSTGSGSITSNSFTVPGIAPSITAAIGATVDAPFNITFTDNASWRAAITSITVGGTTLSPSAYTISSGQITFTPSASSLLQSSGTKAIVVIATGYNNATVSQAIGAGAPAKLAMLTQPTAPATNGAVLAVQPSVAIQDQYGNATTSTASVSAAVGAGTWTLGGTTSVAATSGTTTFSGLTATSAAAVTGATITFTSTALTGVTSNTFNIVAPPPANDLCNNSISLSNGISTSGTSISATYTTLTSEPYTANSDVWYVYTAINSGTVTVQCTNTASIDYDLFAYASTCPTVATGIGSTPTSSTTSETMTFTATAGTTYYIRVVNSTNTTGSTFTINVSQAIASPTLSSSSNITCSSFVANWSSVTSATSYKLDVATNNFPISVSENFENSMSIFSNSGGTYYSGNSLSSEKPLSSPFFSLGSYGFGITNGTATLTSNNLITSSSSNIQLSFKLASFSIGGNGNGADATDIVTVEISPDGGTTYYSTIRVLGNNNATWPFTGTQSASTAYDGNATPVDFQATTNATDGYSLVTITGLPAVANLKVRITLLNNAASERWVIDNFNISGSSNSNYVSGYQDLSVSATSKSVTGLSPNTKYYYRVRSTDGTNTSSNSSVDSVTTTVIPSAPTATATQILCPSATVASLSATGTAVQWYDAASAGNLIPSATALIHNTHYYATQTVNGCESSNRTDVAASLQNQWTSTSNTNWNSSSNWSCGHNPTATENILIPAGVTAVLNADFTLASGYSLTINGTGSLSIDPSHVLTIAGNADFGGRPVTLSSNNSGTAAIGQISGSLTGATNVTVERYIPNNANRAWRNLSVPTYGSQTIANAWQQGTIITGPASCTGMDVTTNGYSMYTYNASTDNLVGVSTTATAINANTAYPQTYFLYVRGDRNTGIANSNANPGATTLKSTGTLYQGTIATDISANNGAATTYHLIGNPYASPINLNSFLTANSSVVENYIYVWDPKMTNTANGVGGIVTLINNGTTYNPSTSLSFSNGVSELPSGLAFFVQKKSPNCSNCSVTFTEAMKSTGALMHNGFKTTSQVAGTMQINLGVKINDSTEGVADGLLAIYDAAADAQVVVSEDADKMNNFGESMSIKNGTALLAVEQRPLLTNDTLAIHILGLSNRNYRLVFNPSQFDPSVKAQLIDHYQNLTYPVAIQQKTVYDFTIDANAASKASDRFELRYNNSSLGIGNTSNIETVSVYPNPTRDAQVFIAMHNQATGTYQVQIVNAMGITVQQYDMNYEKGMRPAVDLSNAAKGVYYLKLSNAQKEQVVVKIINL